MKPEFSRPVEIEKVPSRGLEEEIEADAGELAALAERMKLPAVRSLSARFEIRPWKKGRYRVRGRFHARVDQECVRTLDVFSADVAGEIDRIYLDPALATAAERKAPADLDPEGEDLPDIAEGGIIDLGELAAESLALELDPWPHKPGTDFVDYEAAPPAGERTAARGGNGKDGAAGQGAAGSSSAFSALRRLKE